MMTILIVAWAAFTLIFVVLLIYRGTLTMHEDDQLFLDQAEDHMQKEQQELIGKMDRITPWVRVSGGASAVLIVVMGVKWLLDAMTR